MEYILTNFMLYVRGNFKNVTIYIWQYIHISNFWLAKEVNKELKKEVAASVFIKSIKYYENTNCVDLYS
jgi:hypothetical protein